MNNQVLVRDGKIAFGRNFGSFARGTNSSFDERDLITPHGFFFPVRSATRVVVDILNYNVRAEKIHKASGVSMPSGLAGVLIDPNGKPSLVNLNESLELEIQSHGKNSTIVASGIHGYDNVMLACVDLTDTIEETCAMYRKYANYAEANLIILPITYFKDLYWSVEEERGFHKYLIGETPRPVY